MGFGINNFRSNEELLARKLLIYEKQGLTSFGITIKKSVLNDHMFSSGFKLQEGQILQWKETRNSDEPVIDLKNVYRVVEVESIDPILRFTVEKVEGDWIPKKNVILTEKDRDEAESNVDAHFRRGSLYIKRDSKFARFMGCRIIEDRDAELTYRTEKLNPHEEIIKKDVVAYVFKEEKEFNDDEEEWEEFTYTNLETLIEKEYLHVQSSKEAFLVLMERMTGDEGLVRDTIFIGESDQEDEQTGALVGLASREHLEGMVESAKDKRKNANLMVRGMQRTHALKNREVQVKMDEMRRQMSTELEKINEIKEMAQKQMTVLKKQIGRMEKVIASLEIYAGIKEEIVQINAGDPALEDGLHLRQKVVYLDEEMAVWENQGLVWDKIQDFDDWFMEEERYKEILPEERCIVLANIRRQDRKMDWVDNPFVRMAIQNAENGILVLMRNGDNVYRIFTEHLSMKDRLFPKKAELQEMFDAMSGETENESIENKLFSYNKNMLLIHGILTRTQVFHPIPQHINIMKPETCKDYVKYIYDEEMVIGDAEETFFDYQKRINSTLQVGSRVFIAIEALSDHGNVTANSYDDRYNIYWENDWQRPNLPGTGVYKLKKGTKDASKRNEIVVPTEEFLSEDFDDSRIHSVISIDKEEARLAKLYDDDSKVKWYNKDTLEISFIQGEGYTEDLFQYKQLLDNKGKKNWTRFRIEEGDRFVINMDEVTLDDIEKFVNNKNQRVHYLKIFPILVGLRNRLKQELKNEQEFADSTTRRIAGELGLAEEKVKPATDEAITWYKESLPVRTKRPLPAPDGDDIGKAWKVIILRIKRTLKKKYKLKIDVSGKKKFKSVSADFIIEKKHKYITNSKYRITTSKNCKTKKEFVDLISDMIEKHTVCEPVKSEIKRAMQFHDDETDDQYFRVDEVDKWNVKKITKEKLAVVKL